MIELSYVSLFSGIEAFSVAASHVEGVRWNPVFFSEIDPFPCAVLAHHFPQVPNLGDICKIRIDHDTNTATNGTTTVALPGAGIDILAGGSPCQDLSVAGLRKGAERGSGTRSALFFEYARLVEELRPRILLFENVPGMLSSNQGRDFYYMQSALVDCGYSLAWRILDAQYTVVDGFPRAVPQRRKRVWLVGCAGTDESVPAQILFERPGMLGDTPPRRQAGQGFAAPPGYCVEGNDPMVGGAGGGDANGEVAAPLCAADGKGKNGMDICGKVAVQGVNCLTPGHPEAHRVYGEDGAAPSVCANENAGQNQQAVLVSNSNGENVAPTLDTKTGALTGINGNNDARGGYVIATNSNGEDVMPPITASEYKGAQAQKDKGGGYCIVHELRDVRHGGGSLGVPLGPAGEGHDGCEGGK